MGSEIIRPSGRMGLAIPPAEESKPFRDNMSFILKSSFGCRHRWHCCRFIRFPDSCCQAAAQDLGWHWQPYVVERRLQRLGNELIGNASISKELLHGPICGRARIFIGAPFDARPVEAKACCGRQPSFSTGGKDQHTSAGAVLTNVGIEAPIAHQFGQSESLRLRCHPGCSIQSH